MIAKQSLYLTGDKKTVVPESSPEKRFLLARAGCNVSEKILENYDGALVLARTEAKKAAPVEQPKGQPTHRAPAVTSKEEAPAGTTAAPAGTEGAKASKGKKAPAKGKKGAAAKKSEPPAATYDY